MTRDDPDALGAELRATVAARHELDPSYEHDLLESFLDRLDGVVADRARAEAEDRRRQEKVLRPRPALPFALSVVSLLVGMPVTGVAATTRPAGHPRRLGRHRRGQRDLRLVAASSAPGLRAWETAGGPPGRPTRRTRGSLATCSRCSLACTPASPRSSTGSSARTTCPDDRRLPPSWSCSTARLTAPSSRRPRQAPRTCWWRTCWQTTCPDVLFAYGRRWRSRSIGCDCDACDEDLAEALAAVERELSSVAGGLTEWVRRSDGHVEVGHAYRGGGSEVARLEEDEARERGYVTEQHHEWQPWGRRDLPPDIRVVPYAHPDVARLVLEIQREYVVRYGGEDDTPIVTSELEPPHGLFLVTYDGDVPVAMGGWRLHVEARSGRVPGERAAEIKRMYVVAGARGRGLARRLLAELERTAAAAGCDLMVLETGQAQPEAIALYRSAGYTDIPPFGHYTESDQSVHLAKALAAG